MPYMVKIFFYLFLFTTLTVFGQNLTTQENEIYNAVDAFVANPSDESIKKLDTAEQNFWKNPKPKTKNELLALVVLNCNKAYYQNQFGKTNKAISSYEKAWQIFQKNKLSNYDIIEYCLKPLGNLYTIMGDYDNAENTIKQYYYLAETDRNQSQKIAAILNLSNVYQNTGRINEAIDLLKKTIKTEKLSSIQKGTLLNNLGANYLLFPINENTFNAENAFLAVIPLLKKDKSQTVALYNTYINLYNFYIKYGMDNSSTYLGKASLYFGKAKYIFENLPNPEPRKQAQFYLEYATLLLKKGDLIEVQSVLKSVFKILIPNYHKQKDILPKENSLYAETVLLDALDLQSDLFLAQNQSQKALESFSLSFHIEELFQSLILYENSKIITQIRNRKRTEKCIAIYQSLFEKERKSIYIEKAFQLAEKSKSVVLKEHLINNKNESGKEKLILEQLQNCNTIIIKEQQKREQADIAKINEALKKQNQLMLLLKETHPNTKSQPNETINIKDLYAKLEKNNAVLIEYFWGTKTVYSFTLQNNQITLKSFCTRPMCGEAVPRFISHFIKANSITDNIDLFKKTAFSAFQILQLPTQSSYQNLIIVPDGILNFLPFEALITKQTTTTNFAKMHYLLNDFKIAYNNSASFYLAFDKLKLTKNDKKSILGIFPVFEKTAYELTFSKAEMQSIKNDFDGQFFENANATFENFKKNAANYSILHLSTHASPGDIETPASIKFYDQEILYSELYNLNINPDLVVLSACETGIGKLYLSEGAMSVARGFQFAGAKNLLFSLWKVNDYTTSVFMDYFYKNLKSGESYFEANTNAKLDFLKDKTISNAKKSPYYWSAFVYYGDIETIENRTNYSIYIIGLFIAIVLFMGFKYIKK
jgi:CHAT domain-containing protein